VATYREEEWMSVREAVATHNMSEPALRKALLKERITPGSGIVSLNFSGIFGVLVSKLSLKAYVERTQPDGERPKGRPRTRPVVEPSSRGRGRPRKAIKE